MPPSILTTWKSHFVDVVPETSPPARPLRPNVELNISPPYFAHAAGWLPVSCSKLPFVRSPPNAGGGGPDGVGVAVDGGTGVFVAVGFGCCDPPLLGVGVLVGVGGFGVFVAVAPPPLPPPGPCVGVVVGVDVAAALVGVAVAVGVTGAGVGVAVGVGVGGPTLSNSERPSIAAVKSPPVPLTPALNRTQTALTGATVVTETDPNDAAENNPFAPVVSSTTNPESKNVNVTDAANAAPSTSANWPDASRLAPPLTSMVWVTDASPLAWIAALPMAGAPPIEAAPSKLHGDVPASKPPFSNS